jgi:tRNA(fMet)-specific endonuclease VapC
VNYRLDTNACMAISGTPTSVRSHFQKTKAAGAEIFVSTIVAFELWYGIATSSRDESNRNRIATFFAGPITLLAFEDEAAQRAGWVRAALETSGKPIGAYDVLLAGQALQRPLTLVTANTSEFSHLKNPLWQDWAKLRGSNECQGGGIFRGRAERVRCEEQQRLKDESKINNCQSKMV